MEPAVIIHGGAWSIPDSLVERSREGVKRAALKGLSVLREGRSAVDAVEAAVIVLEDDSAFDAGNSAVSIYWIVWHWPAIMISTISQVDEVVHKTCCFDLDLFTKKLLIFPHCTMNGSHFVDTITHSTIWHWPSIMSSTVSYDDEWWSCAQDLELALTFLQGHKKHIICPHCTITGGAHHN